MSVSPAWLSDAWLAAHGQRVPLRGQAGAGAPTVRIERVTYDAGSVARQVAAAGLPAEYAEKLVRAA